MGLTAEPLVYANALLKLEEQRLQNIAFTIAATAGKMGLLTRIRRMVEGRNSAMSPRQFGFTFLLLIISLAPLSWLTPPFKNGQLSFDLARITSDMINRSFQDRSVSASVDPSLNRDIEERSNLAGSPAGNIKLQDSKDSLVPYLSDEKLKYHSKDRKYQYSTPILYSSKQDTSRIYDSKKQDTYHNNDRNIKTSTLHQTLLKNPNTVKTS